MLVGAVAVPIDLRLTRRGARVDRGGGAGRSVARAPACATPDSLPRSSSARRPRGSAVHELDAVCAVIHTSGTTSAPRPVELTYGNFLWSALGSSVALGVDPEERWLCAMPLSHVGGLSILIRSAIYATTAVVHERFDAAEVLRALRQGGITLVSLVSTTLARLLDAGLRDPPKLALGAHGRRAACPALLVQRAHAAGVPAVATYGLTEACSQVSTGGPPSVLHADRVWHEDGEILVGGPTVAPGSLRSGWPAAHRGSW